MIGDIPRGRAKIVPRAVAIVTDDARNVHKQHEANPGIGSNWRLRPQEFVNSRNREPSQYANGCSKRERVARLVHHHEWQTNAYRGPQSGPHDPIEPLRGTFLDSENAAQKRK